jgi:protein-S-isoprenylcysteine O-methyltransferase Ste14
MLPPLVVVVAFAAAMWLVAAHLPAFAMALPARLPIATGLALGGLVVVASGVIAFRRARTTVSPLVPEEARALVTDGIYRCSRNPMYLGFLVVLAGWGVYLANAAAFVALPCFMLLITRMQIVPEEHALDSKFGQPYRDYVRRVRRWL